MSYTTLIVLWLLVTLPLAIAYGASIRVHRLEGEVRFLELRVTLLENPDDDVD